MTSNDEALTPGADRTATAPAAGDETRTLVRVEKGHADPDELAAVVAVLFALARTADSPRPIVTVPLPAVARWTADGHITAPHSWQTVS